MEIIILQIFGTVLLLAGIFLLVYWLKRKQKFLNQFKYNKGPEIDDFEELLSSSFYKSYNKDYSGAVDDINKALKIKPHFERLYFQRGKLKEELKDFEGARADYTKAILLKENYDVAYLNRGLVKLKQKDYNGAKRDFSKAQQLNSNLKEANFFKQEAEINITKLNNEEKKTINFVDKDSLLPKGKAQ